ncbi:hypothetical protein EJV46_05900 [Roseococcus sp. SYP-B2431]|nr:hypothetical protein EJV46_05900 [Roseococcus sp. SYP-B2431]
MTSADVFLMRYISILDCAVILTNVIYELGLNIQKCTINNIRKKGAPPGVVKVLSKMLDDQGALRDERNARFHHGTEHILTDDDQVFHALSMLERMKIATISSDSSGNKLDVSHFFGTGLYSLQIKFNKPTKSLVKSLNIFYNIIEPDFEGRFGPLVAAATHGFCARREKQAWSFAPSALRRAFHPASDRKGDPASRVPAKALLRLHPHSRRRAEVQPSLHLKLKSSLSRSFPAIRARRG